MMSSEFISQTARKIKDKENLRGVPQIRKMTATAVYGRAETRNLSMKSSSIEVFFHVRSSSFKVSLPSKVVFHQRSSSIKGRLLSRVSIKDRLLSKAVFYQGSFSIEGCLDY